MKRWMKILFCVTFSFLFCFMCIGYAELTDTLTIEGSAEATPPTAVYIVKVDHESVNVSECSVVPLTTVKSSLALTAGDASSTATMQITVKNNTTETYYYNGTVYSPETYSNAGIKVSTDIEKAVIVRDTVTGTSIAAGETMTFTATFLYASPSNVSQNTLTSYINYQFVTYNELEIGEDVGVARDILGYMKDILNGDAEIDEEKYPGKSSWDILKEKMDSGQSSESGAYIANFEGANAEDREFLRELFGEENLNLIINDQEVNVKIMIKREDISTKHEGDEMVLYMTTHSLEKDGGIFSTTYAEPVYVSVFGATTANGETTWAAIGDMYAGRARVNGYNGSSWGEGSFNTDTWRSTQAYHGVNSGSEIEDILAAVPGEP